MYKKTILSNAITIASESMGWSNSMVLAVWIKLGSRDEAEGEEGICHLLEHMLFKGTHKRDAKEIAKLLDSIGGLSDALTGKESMCFYTKFLPKHLPLVKDITLDILKNPRFDESDLALEKQVIFQEIKTIEDSPEDHIYDILAKALFGEHPLGRPVIGRKESLKAITSDRLKEFWSSRVSGHNLYIFGAGRCQHDKLVEEFAPELLNMNNKGGSLERKAPVARHGIEVLEKDLEQVHVCIGFEAPGLREDSRVVCGVLSCILGGNMSSRLFQKVREDEGLVYTIYTSYYPYSDTGVFSIYFATDGDKVNEVMEIVKAELKELCASGPSLSELRNAQDYHVAGLYLNTESPESRMFRNAKMELNLGTHVSLEELEVKVSSLTRKDIQEMAHKIFKTNSYALCAIGPIKKEYISGDLL